MIAATRRLAAALIALALAACGGGGGGTPAPPPPAPPPPAGPPPGVDLSEVARADPGSLLDADWVHGAFMQIFVRSYQDSDGDGQGDLRGLIQRLDYLKDLGVRGLWLLPVTRSQDADHGYAVSNYRDIETAYGNVADLDELLRQAHARGIGVVLDYVINHSAATHPLFQAARTDAASPYRNWYLWQASVPAGWSVFGSNPWRASSTGAYYAPFWDQMPDWNLRLPAVLDFHRNNLRFWLNRGVDGFRFDAVGLLVENGASAWENQPENLTVMQGLRQEIDQYAKRFTVCEAPSAASSFASACGRAFAFGQQSTLLAAARGDSAALMSLATQPDAPALSPFLSNHDGFAGERPFDQLAGSLPQLKLAASLNLLRSGTPFIYYGEEVGMGGGAGLSADPRLRSPMSWSASNRGSNGFSTATPYRALAANVAAHNVAAQSADPDSLLAHYRALLALRNSQPALRRGSLLQAQANGSSLAYWRRLDGEQLLVVVHSGTQARSGLSLSGAPAHGRLQPLMGSSGELLADAQGQLSLNLPPQSTHVFKVVP